MTIIRQFTDSWVDYSLETIGDIAQVGVVEPGEFELLLNDDINIMITEGELWLQASSSDAWIQIPSGSLYSVKGKQRYRLKALVPCSYMRISNAIFKGSPSSRIITSDQQSD